MKGLTITLFLLSLSVQNIFAIPGEIWFYIDDNNNTNFKVVARRISLTEPLFGYNFMEIGNSQFDEVTSDTDVLGNPLAHPWDVLRGFDYLRDPHVWPLIGEGKLEFSIYRDGILLFQFGIDLVHYPLPPQPLFADITFYFTATTNSLIAYTNGIYTEILNNSFVNCWELQGMERNISKYVNPVGLTNLVGGVVENNIKTTFNAATMGFPYGDVQLGVPYNPGTNVRLWRGVEYGLSTSHSTYTKNGIIYNFRNWIGYEAYTMSSTLRVLDGTDEFRSMYYPTIPLTVSNNLEGGSSSNDFEITWQTPPITQTWQYGIPFNAFSYPLFLDLYSATATNQFQALSTTWWFYKWNDGSTNRLKQNLQITSPTNLTAYYKGHLRSNDQNAISSGSQRKLIRTDNGIYHCVYESMGEVWYTHSLTTNFQGAWSQDYSITEGQGQAKNPAIDYEGNEVKIVFEYYDPQQGGDAKIFAAIIGLYGNGTYTYEGSEEVASYSNSYFSNAKPVISYGQWEIFIAYRNGPAGGLKQKTKFSDGTYWGCWSAEDDIPGTNADCINPSITGFRQIANLAYVFIVYENFGTIYFKQARRWFDNYGNSYWDYQSYATFADILSKGSGFNLNRYPVISLANQNSANQYLMVSWQGIYNGTPTNPFPKTDGSVPLYREAAVVKTRNGSTWGTSSSFSKNVDYTSNGSLNNLYGSILTWSESDGQYSKYVRRRTSTGYDPITSLSNNGIQTLVSNGSDFGNLKAMVFNNSTSAPYFLNRCIDDFTYIPDGLGKITEDGLIDISYGRSGIVEKNGIEFVFNIGDVLLDGETIKFIERADTIPILNLEELNALVRTDTLNLDAESELIFSDYYYVVDSEIADSLLSDDLNVNFKCQLVKLSSGEVVGEFEEVNYNKNNLEAYGYQGYLIDCTGIAAGKYYLRLATSVNEEVNLSLSDIQMDEVLLEKSKLNVRNFKGSELPLEYSLEQNYPNPFNPNTVISYQLPVNGFVTLKVYDILGSEVTTLVNEEKTAGRYEINYNASSLASGVYLYKLQVNDFINVKKMILLK